MLCYWCITDGIVFVYLTYLTFESCSFCHFDFYTYCLKPELKVQQNHVNQLKDYGEPKLGFHNPTPIMRGAIVLDVSFRKVLYTELIFEVKRPHKRLLDPIIKVGRTACLI